MKLKSVFTAKDIIDKKTTYCMEEKIFKWYDAAHIIQHQKTNNLIKKWTEYGVDIFSKEEKLMTNRHVKRCSASLIHQENANQNHSETSYDPGIPSAMHPKNPHKTLIQKHYAPNVHSSAI